MRRTTTSVSAPERPLWLGPYTVRFPRTSTAPSSGTTGGTLQVYPRPPKHSFAIATSSSSTLDGRWQAHSVPSYPNSSRSTRELPSLNPSGSRQEPRSSRQEAWITSVTHPSSTPSRSWRSSAFKSSSWDSLKAIGWQEDPSGKPQKGYTQGNPSTLSVSLKTPTPSSNFRLKKKNGRLAMLAMLGMYVQALITGKGPVSNWLEHLADPSSANGFAFATKFAPTLLASRSDRSPRPHDDSRG